MIIGVAFQEFKNHKIPPPFMIHVYRLLMQEIAEAETSRTRHEIIQDMQGFPMADEPVPSRLIKQLQSILAVKLEYESLAEFMKRMPWFYHGSRPDGADSLFTKRSLFGYFVRRCCVSFIKLSFSGTMRLIEDYNAWVAGDLDAGYEYDPRNERDAINSDAVMSKTAADKQNYGDPSIYFFWEKGFMTNDEVQAVDSISRYFEQRFTEARDSRNRQGLLMHLIRMHYARQEYGAVRKLLTGAISVCRMNGDRIGLQHCMAIMHRLPPTERGQKPFLNTVQPDLHPVEILFDVKKLMQVQNEQPLSASFEKIYQFIGWYDQWIDLHGNILRQRDQDAFHAVHSLIWSIAGCGQLSTLEEQLVLIFTEVRGDDNNRLTVTINQAYKRARNGEYLEAIAMLFEPNVWRGLSMNNYNLWAAEIWHILVLRATRRGQIRLFREFLQPRRPAGHFNPKEYFNDLNAPSLSIIRDPLHETVHMMSVHQGSAMVDKLLVALWHAEFQCRYGLYRTGLVMLADISMEFGLSQKARRMVEDVMPQIIHGGDLEQRAYACFTLARCIIMSGRDAENVQSPASMREAVPYLKISEADYLKIEIYAAARRVQYVLSVVYNTLNMTTERDAAVKRLGETEEKAKVVSGQSADAEMVEIINLVSEVGVGLAARE